MIPNLLFSIFPLPSFRLGFLRLASISRFETLIEQGASCRANIRTGSHSMQCIAFKSFRLIMPVGKVHADIDRHKVYRTCFFHLPHFMQLEGSGNKAILPIVPVSPMYLLLPVYQVKLGYMPSWAPSNDLTPAIASALFYYIPEDVSILTKDSLGCLAPVTVTILSIKACLS